jgi:hypothetical protein
MATYQQQLLEGVAEVVGQSIEQVKSVFVKQVEKAQVQAPSAIEHGASMPDDNPIKTKNNNTGGAR